MNAQQLTITRLIGKKELSFWCIIGHKEKIFVFVDNHAYDDIIVSNEYDKWAFRNIDEWCGCCSNSESFSSSYDVIWHPATISDLHRHMNKNHIRWEQNLFCIKWIVDERWNYMPIEYDSDKDLLDQSTETLAQIIELINNSGI